MTAASDSSAASPAPPRRVLFVGAGPLPAEGSAQAPGVANRLWHFVQPALAAGHACFLLSIESGAPGLGELGQGGVADQFEARSAQGRSYHLRRVRAEDCLAPERLAELVRALEPDVLVGAGTLLAGATACALTGERPVWGDLFGDPLAEIQAKAALLAEGFPLDDHLQVWRLMLAVLRRADAFSTVSRRQADALLGQLALAGRLDASTSETAGPGELLGARAMIHPMPCALESLDFLPEGVGGTEEGREAWRRGHGLPAGARVALWSGGFNAWADPRTLVAGVEAALDCEPALHLVATGGELPGYLGQVYEEFKALVERSRHRARLHALGWLPLGEANGWLKAAELGLMVDRPCAETRLGARNRLLYHAAARCPVVASRGSEVVEEMEAAGALRGFDSGRPEALAEAILHLLAQPEQARATGERGYAFSREHYLFAASSAPFLGFIAQPWRSGSPPSEELAATWIGRYLDIPRRDAEWAELTRRRAGLLARIARRFGRG